MNSLLKVKRVEQRARFWCWAACGEMLGRFFLKDIPQCELVNRQFQVTSACANPASSDLPIGLDDVTSALGSWGLHSSRVPSALSGATIAQEIGAQRPLLVMISLGPQGITSGIRHMVVVSGYRNDGAQEMLYRIDPFPHGGEGWVARSQLDWKMSWKNLHV